MTNWVHSQDAADEAHELRHGWQGQYRPWHVHEPCPAQVRDRLAPGWRHFAAGQPHYEDVAGLPTGGQDESPRVDAAPALRSPQRLVRPPYVHLKRTKTAGWQLVYVCKSGRREIVARNLEFEDAMVRGAARARIQDCPLEVDR